MAKEDINNEILLSHKKEQNFTTYSNMDGLEVYYAKWNRSDRKRKILCVITDRYNLKNH